MSRYHLTELQIQVFYKVVQSFQALENSVALSNLKCLFQKKQIYLHFVDTYKEINCMYFKRHLKHV